eukprot:scaffold514938_cov30-Prasinocladus_malaysianus.AAC.1
MQPTNRLIPFAFEPGGWLGNHARALLPEWDHKLNNQQTRRRSGAPGTYHKATHMHRSRRAFSPCSRELQRAL